MTTPAKVQEWLRTNDGNLTDAYKAVGYEGPPLKLKAGNLSSKRSKIRVSPRGENGDSKRAANNKLRPPQTKEEQNRNRRQDYKARSLRKQGKNVHIDHTVELKLLPASGMYSLYGGGDLIDLLKHLIMPSTALAIVSTGVVVRLSRSIMLEILRLDFIRTARSKGLKEYRVIFIHAFRLAIVSILPILGLQAGFVLSGAVYIEIVFQWPGVGRMLVDSILTRDIMLVQGGVLFVALCYVIFNIVVDFLQLILDPRIREE